MPESETSDSLELQNVTVEELLTLSTDAPLDFDEHSSAPGTPDSGKVRVYAKQDGLLYQKDDAGTETIVGLAASAIAIEDLSDVAAKEGSGTTVVFSDSPTLTTPSLDTPVINDFTDANHDHADVAGGGTIALTDLTGQLGVASGGTARTAAPTMPMILRAFDGRGTNTSGGGDASQLPETAETAGNAVNYFYLAMATGESCFWNVPMPLNWDAGTITATMLWTAAAGSDDIKFEVKGISFADSDALDTAMGAAQSVEDTLLTAEDVHITSATAAITLAGTPAAGEYVCIEVKRVAPAGTDLVGDIRLLGVRLLYTAAGYSET